MSGLSRAAIVASKLFGTAPALQNNLRSGNKVLRQQILGQYARYYEEPISPYVRQVIPGYKSPLEERRAEKTALLKRRGKGAPPKGSGKRTKKKK